jgi:hypothetical protein
MEGGLPSNEVDTFRLIDSNKILTGLSVICGKPNRGSERTWRPSFRTPSMASEPDDFAQWISLTLNVTDVTSSRVADLGESSIAGVHQFLSKLFRRLIRELHIVDICLARSFICKFQISFKPTGQLISLILNRLQDFGMAAANGCNGGTTNGIKQLPPIRRMQVDAFTLCRREQLERSPMKDSRLLMR